MAEEHPMILRVEIMDEFPDMISNVPIDENQEEFY